MKFIKHIFLLKLVFALTVFSNVSSCSNEGSKESSQAIGEVTLIHKDSIKIYDYDSENNFFLLGDVADGFSEMLPDGVMPKGNEVGFIIIDGSGEVHGQFNNTGDGLSIMVSGLGITYFLTRIG